MVTSDEHSGKHGVFLGYPKDMPPYYAQVKLGSEIVAVHQKIIQRQSDYIDKLLLFKPHCYIARREVIIGVVEDTSESYVATRLNDESMGVDVPWKDAIAPVIAECHGWWPYEPDESEESIWYEIIFCGYIPFTTPGDYLYSLNEWQHFFV